MNKKGALFHWIVFGILAGLAFFYLTVQTTDLGLSIKGDWHLNFLQNYYLEGEKELIQVDRQAIYAGKSTAFQLAENGGFIDDSNCGNFGGINYWNKESEFCFPDDVSKKFNEFMDYEYSLSYAGEELLGTTEDGLTIDFTSKFQEKALAKLPKEELECLKQDNHVPEFKRLGGFESCVACPQELDCTKYVNSFYCDFNACGGCVGSYVANTYIGCLSCPEERSCDEYRDQYHCELDSCNYNCKWDVSSCKESDTQKEELDAVKKITYITFPEAKESTTYTIKPNFRVNIDYSFDEYEQLQFEADFLLNKCKNDAALQNCLNSKPSNWKFSDCDNENFVENDRKVPFCVISTGNLPVTYKLGLDFTPGIVLAVADMKVDYSNGMYLVTFTQDKDAERYKVYFSDNTLIKETDTGQASSIFVSRFDFFADSHEVQTLESCLETKEVGKAYLCGNDIIYALVDERLLAGGKYAFGVTIIKDGQESWVRKVIKLN
jgi:hypothetical protein